MREKGELFFICFKIANTFHQGSFKIFYSKKTNCRIIDSSFTGTALVPGLEVVDVV